MTGQIGLGQGRVILLLRHGKVLLINFEDGFARLLRDSNQIGHQRFHFQAVHQDFSALR